MSELVAAELARVLTLTGIAICKVMDSRFRGRLIRNHDIIADAFERHGFRMRDQIVYIRTVTGTYVNTKTAQSTHGYFSRDATRGTDGLGAQGIGVGWGPETPRSDAGNRK